MRIASKRTEMQTELSLSSSSVLFLQTERSSCRSLPNYMSNCNELFTLKNELFSGRLSRYLKTVQVL